MNEKLDFDQRFSLALADGLTKLLIAAAIALGALSVALLNNFSEFAEMDHRLRPVMATTIMHCMAGSVIFLFNAFIAIIGKSIPGKIGVFICNNLVILSSSIWFIIYIVDAAGDLVRALAGVQ